MMNKKPIIYLSVASSSTNVLEIREMIEMLEEDAVVHYSAQMLGDLETGFVSQQLNIRLLG